MSYAAILRRAILSELRRSSVVAEHGARTHWAGSVLTRRVNAAVPDDELSFRWWTRIHNGEVVVQVRYLEQQGLIEVTRGTSQYEAIALTSKGRRMAREAEIQVHLDLRAEERESRDGRAFRFAGRKTA
jgi:hypothetical protein